MRQLLIKSKFNCGSAHAYASGCAHLRVSVHILRHRGQIKTQQSSCYCYSHILMHLRCPNNKTALDSHIPLPYQPKLQSAHWFCPVRCKFTSFPLQQPPHLLPPSLHTDACLTAHHPTRQIALSFSVCPQNSFNRRSWVTHRKTECKTQTHVHSRVQTEKSAKS